MTCLYLLGVVASYVADRSITFDDSSPIKKTTALLGFAFYWVFDEFIDPRNTR